MTKTKHQTISKAMCGMVAAAAANLILAGSALADSKDAPNATKAAKVGKCVHDCAGNATCKGHGNNSCKGKNDCAGQGGVPPECSSQASSDSCKKVLDKRHNTMCTWLTEN